VERVEAFEDMGRLSGRSLVLRPLLSVHGPGLKSRGARRIVRKGDDDRLPVRIDLVPRGSEPDLTVRIVPASLQPIGEDRVRRWSRGPIRAAYAQEYLVSGLPSLDCRTIGEAPEMHRPGLIPQQALRGVPMLVQSLQIAEDTRNPLAGDFEVAMA
jgi:hypothetical protein